MKIAQITDIHLNDFLSENSRINAEENLAKILHDLDHNNCRRIIFTGDQGNTKSFDVIMEHLQKYSIDTFFILGNHDKKYTFKMFFVHQSGNRTYWSENIEDFLVLYLDSGKNKIGWFQLNWIRKCLNETNKDNIIVFIHHPVLFSENSIMEKKYPLKNKKKIQTVFHNSQKNIYVFCGHYHTDEKQVDKKITQYIAPAASVQIKQQTDKIEIETKDYGYRIIEIGKNNISEQVKYFKGK